MNTIWYNSIPRYVPKRNVYAYKCIIYNIWKLDKYSATEIMVYSQNDILFSKENENYNFMKKFRWASHSME